MPAKTDGAPTLAPPVTRTQELSIERTGDSRPRDISVEHVAAQGGQAEPVLTPPGASATATVSAPPIAVTGTWTANVVVDAMWAANETRNVFFHTTANVWKKIFNGTDSAFTNLVALAAQARQTGHQISFREEADGMVHEIYLW